MKKSFMKDLRNACKYCTSLQLQFLYLQISQKL